MKKFIENTKSDITIIMNELVTKVGDLKVGGESKELNDRLNEIKSVLEHGHTWIVKRIEKYVRSVIKETLYKKTADRTKIEAMLYNFVDGDVPEEVKKLLENGMNSVPSTKLTKQQVDRRVGDALLEYVMRFGRRRIYGNAVLQATNVQEWLKKVKIFNMDQDSRKFVEELENYYPALKSELDLVYTDVDMDTKEDLVRKMEKDGCVLVNCDKNMGMSLFKLKTMRKADEALMSQLGAVRMESPFGDTKEEIIKCVYWEIEKFEDGLNDRQRQYLDAVFKDRHFDKAEVIFPFLKSLHKVHKMSEEEIKNKDLNVIKFRPVVDSRQWLTKGYSGVIMQMMRELVDKLLEKSGSILRNMKTKDGWRFAVGIREYIVEEDYDVMVTADIQEAYTNINDAMIKKAIGVVGELVGCEEWKLELMKKLIDLVLGQNYAETSGGVFKFKKSLPIG